MNIARDFLTLGIVILFIAALMGIPPRPKNRQWKILWYGYIIIGGVLTIIGFILYSWK